jgi:hypothetical protein
MPAVGRQDPELWAEFEAAVAGLQRISPLTDEVVDVLRLHYNFDVPAVRTWL